VRLFEGMESSYFNISRDGSRMSLPARHAPG
jgi:hypothetical protein